MTADDVVTKARALAQAEVDGNEIVRMLAEQEADYRRLQEHMEPFYREVEAQFLRLIAEGRLSVGGTPPHGED